MISPTVSGPSAMDVMLTASDGLIRSAVGAVEHPRMPRVLKARALALADYAYGLLVGSGADAEMDQQAGASGYDGVRQVRAARGSIYHLVRQSHPNRQFERTDFGFRGSADTVEEALRKLAQAFHEHEGLTVVPRTGFSPAEQAARTAVFDWAAQHPEAPARVSAVSLPLAGAA